MNTVRSPAAGQDWAAVERVVRLANRLELLALVEADDAPPAIRDNPNVILSVRRGSGRVLLVGGTAPWPPPRPSNVEGAVSQECMLGGPKWK